MKLSYGKDPLKNLTFHNIIYSLVNPKLAKYVVFTSLHNKIIQAYLKAMVAYNAGITYVTRSRGMSRRFPNDVANLV